MSEEMREEKESIDRRHRTLLLTAAAMTYLLVTAGGVVCATESGHGCPDWPGCYGQALPPLRVDAIIEYTHRFIALLTGPLILVTAIISWRRARRIRWVSWTAALAVLLVVVVAVFGALVVLRGLPPSLAAVDLGSALTVLALMVTAAVAGAAHYARPQLPDRLSWRTPLARLAASTLVLLFVLLVSGVLVAEAGSIERCLGWPLYRGAGLPADLHGWLLLGRRLLATVVTLLIGVVVVQGWRAPGERQALRGVAVALGLALVAHILVGALLVSYGFSTGLLILYPATVAAVWALLVALVVLSALPQAAGEAMGTVGAARQQPQFRTNP